MKQLILASTLGFALIASAAWIPSHKVRAVSFSSPEDSAPQKATGGASRTIFQSGTAPKPQVALLVPYFKVELLLKGLEVELLAPYFKVEPLLKEPQEGLLAPYFKVEPLLKEPQEGLLAPYFKVEPLLKEPQEGLLGMAVAI